MHGLSPPFCIVLVQQKPVQGCHCGWFTFGIGVGWCLSMQESCKGCQCSDSRHPFFDCNPAIHWHSCLHCNGRCSNLKLFPKCFDLCPWMIYALSFPCSSHLWNSCFLSLCFWTCGSVHIAELELHTLKWLLCLVQCHVYLCWACWALLDNYSYCSILLTQSPSGARKTSCNSQLLEPIYTSSTQQVVSVLLLLLVGIMGGGRS
jgi:hypothetical protein